MTNTINLHHLRQPNPEYMEWEEFEEYILLAASCFEMDNEEEEE